MSAALVAHAPSGEARLLRSQAIPHIALLFVGICLTLAPHAARLPPWITGITLALIAWRGWAAYSGERLPRKWLIFLLVLAGLFAVYTSNRTLIGRDAGVTMLVMFLGLKLLETRQERDVIVVTFLCYFLVLTHFFYGQTILTAVHTTATVIVLTAALVGFNAVHRPWLDNVRTAATLFLQALPIMFTLFLLFPRFNGPLWGLPESAAAGMTGLGDTMAPGTISTLSQSDAIAFRVKFDGETPDRHVLYWRGPVLDRFDGLTWRHAAHRAIAPGDAVKLRYHGDAVGYEVTLEPNNQHWLLALDIPGSVPPDSQYSAEYELVARRPVQQRIRYRVSSYVNYVAEGGDRAAEQPEDLALPPGLNPRTAAMGQQWRRELGSPEAVVRRAAQFFSSQGLAYTLTPPPLGQNTADDFLFETRQGFCEHFSSAYVILMRAAGIPARVVTGYQGGETNPVDDYFVVRQADAHAWAEVWLGERGWVREDPTAMANPMRVEQGLAQAVPAGDPVPYLIRANFGWLTKVRHNWEALANGWNQWVLGYNLTRQRELLSQLGMKSPSLEKLINTMLWTVGIALAAVSGLMLHHMHRREPAQALWNRFCRRAAQRGLARAPHEGPARFIERLAERFPQSRDQARAIADLYIALRYGPHPGDRALLGALRRGVRQCRL